MEHTQKTRTIAAALVVAATTCGLAACASGSEAGRVAITHRMLVRESADRYVDELIERAHASMQPSESGVDDGQGAVRPVPTYRDQSERQAALAPDPASPQAKAQPRMPVIADLDPRGLHGVPQAGTALSAAEAGASAPPTNSSPVNDNDPRGLHGLPSGPR